MPYAAILTGVLFAILLPCTLFAAGTPAGTVISSQATVRFVYGVDPAPRSVVSNIVSVTVAQVAAVNLTPATGSDYARLSSTVDYSFSLVNSGNGTDKFSISWTSSIGLTGQVYLDANADQILNPVEVSAGPVSQTPDILEDRSMNFVLRLSIPDSTSMTGKTDAFVLTASSVFDPAKRATLTRSTNILAALLALRKSVNRTIPRAGERVMYTISYSNSGNTQATGMSLTDVLDPRLRYVVGSATPAPDSVSGQAIIWKDMSVPGYGSGVIWFQVDILNNVPAATEVHNVVTGQYQDGPTIRTVTSTETNFLTVQGSGYTTVDIRSDTSASGEPGDTLQYAFLVTNNGVLAEDFDLHFASSAGLAWTFYEDPGGTGRPAPGAAPITNTGPLEGGSRFYLVARTVLPPVSLDRTQDLTTFRVQSSMNQANYKTANGSTAINTPKMTLVKRASAPEPLAGSEITYTITFTNTGHGGAYGFAITDSIPVNTMYVSGSTTLNGIAKTDETDGDGVAVRAGVVTVNVGTVEPNRSGTIAFRVRIL